MNIKATAQSCDAEEKSDRCHDGSEGYCDDLIKAERVCLIEGVSVFSSHGKSPAVYTM